MKDWWIKLIVMILSNISGPLREVMVKTLKEWESKAKETEDPWDDLFVGIVKWLLMVP